MSCITVSRLRALAVPALLALSLVPGPEARSQQPVQFDASQWPVWIIASPSEFRLPPPPDGAATQAELAELRRLAGGRDAATRDRLRYWTVGGPSYRWNEIMAAEGMKRGIPTPLFARHAALLNTALSDAVIAAWDSKAAHARARPATADPGFASLVPSPGTPSYPSDHAAVAAAASMVLGALFPDAAERFGRMAREAGEAQLAAGLAYPSDVEAGVVLGRRIGERAIARGAADGSAARWTGTVPTGPGRWRGETPALPLAGTWKTWVLTRPDEVRPPPPPAHDGPEVAAAMAELRAIRRDPAMTGAAWFWEHGAGGLRNVPFWTGIALRKVLEYGLGDSPPGSARAFASLSIAMADAGVACWDAKYAYWFIRPSQLDAEFRPLFPPPSHPAYPSAHSCFSVAAATVLAGLFPADAELFEATAKEASEARLWAGIHYRFDIVAGSAIGRQVGEKVLAASRLDAAR